MKTWIITGASSGIGKETALEVLRRGDEETRRQCRYYGKRYEASERCCRLVSEKCLCSGT